MKRRLVEPTPVWKRCAWLNKCHGAKSIEQHWSAYGLWCVGLWNALDLPEFEHQHARRGRPVELAIVEREAA